MAKNVRQLPTPFPEMSAAEWLSRAPKSLQAEAAAIRDSARERLKTEHEAALQRARDVEAQLRELDPEGDAAEPKAKVWTIRSSRDLQESPSAEWSIARLVKHYLRAHPRSLAGDVSKFVTSVRPDDEEGTVDANVLSVLYKYSRNGGVLKKTGERGSFRYSLREEAET